MKSKKCRHCRQEFQPFRPLQVACSVECAAFLAAYSRKSAENQQKKAERKEIKARKEAMKSRAQWAREAQSAVNSYVRERDKNLPCISCGRFHQGAHDAGHYRSVGAAPALRFDLANIHRQCVPCNQHKSGNILEYRIGLIAKIGAQEVARLEGPIEFRKWSIDDLKAIKSEYRAKLKELKKRVE